MMGALRAPRWRESCATMASTPPAPAWNGSPTLVERAFWAQSIDLKCRFGWKPPAAEGFPRRVYEVLSLTLERPVEKLQSLIALLIGEWKRQAGEMMTRFGYEAAL